MNKIIFLKNINSLFIVIILLAGTLSQPSSFSFMTTASAQTESSGKDVGTSSLNCNNLNANVNGLQLEVLPTALSTLLTNGETDDKLYSYGSNSGSYGGESSGSEINDFRFICINNNNNTVIGGEESIPPTSPVPPVDECLLCFEETTQAVREAVIATLEAEGPLVIVPGVYEVPEEVTTIEGLCEWLTENAPLELFEIQIELLINTIGNVNPSLPSEQIDELVDCLIEAGFIEVVIPTCDDCFDVLGSELIDIINNILLNPNDIPIQGTNVVIPPEVDDVIALCAFLDTQAIEVNEANFQLVVNSFISLTGGNIFAGLVLANCLVDAGIINIIEDAT
jgi:hypothetical protein